MCCAAGDRCDDVFTVVGVVVVVGERGEGVERGGSRDGERLIDLIAFGTHARSMNLHQSELIARSLQVRSRSIAACSL